MKSRLLVVLLFGFLACTSTPPTIVYDWNGKESLCESTLMLSDSSLVGVAGLNMVGADQAILYDRGGEYCLKLCKVSGDSLLWQRNLLRHGRGPLEATTPNVNYLSEFGKVCVFKDNMVSTEGIFLIDSKNVSVNANGEVWNVSRLSDKNPVRLRVPVDTTIYLADAPLETNEVFGLYSPGDSGVRNIGLGYPSEMSRYSSQTRAMVLSGFVVKRPDESTFANSSQHGRFVQIFDIRDGKAVNIRTLYNELPQFDLDNANGGFRFRDESQLGFWVFATHNYLYLLDAGITAGDMRRGKRGERTVNVFRWDGTPVRKLHFDSDIAMFSVTPDDKHLYFTTVDLDAGQEQIRRVVL